VRVSFSRIPTPESGGFLIDTHPWGRSLLPDHFLFRLIPELTLRNDLRRRQQSTAESARDPRCRQPGYGLTELRRDSFDLAVRPSLIQQRRDFLLSVC
jgi:hypothetical protein